MAANGRTLRLLPACHGAWGAPDVSIAGQGLTCVPACRARAATRFLCAVPFSGRVSFSLSLSPPSPSSSPSPCPSPLPVPPPRPATALTADRGGAAHTSLPPPPTTVFGSRADSRPGRDTHTHTSCYLKDLLFETKYAAQIFDWQNAVFLLFMPLLLALATFTFRYVRVGGSLLLLLRSILPLN